MANFLKYWGNEDENVELIKVILNVWLYFEVDVTIIFCPLICDYLIKYLFIPLTFNTYLYLCIILPLNNYKFERIGNVTMMDFSIQILSESLTEKTDFLDFGWGSTSRSNFFIFFAYLIWVPGTDLSENGFFGILAIF